MKLWILFLAMMATPAQAAIPSLCAPWAALHAKLRDDGQVQIVSWKEQDHTLRMLYGNPTSREWTLIMVDSEGRACTMRHGDLWMKGEVG